MVALTLLVTLALALGHWLMAPLAAALTPLMQLQLLPWVLLLLAGWLIAGRSADNP